MTLPPLDSPLVDENGYPLPDTLARIQVWHYTDFPELMVFLRSLWTYKDWAWKETAGERRTHYSISTGGWSGNEDLIQAMQENLLFWGMCWVSSRRGGHYEFEVRTRKEPDS